MDAEPQAILVARRDLARLEHPARPAFEAQQRGDIVVEAPARHMRREFGAERFDRQPRDMFGELKGVGRSEEHTSELQSLMRNSYDAFCLKKTNNKYQCI